ncbi:protocatechuate 3,4-dioxygenase, P3,4O [Polychaeton citri CBS 116435]|uniref:Protocatechuate 3,4-dioxygenase, P3,4O n=1 Tax=Polychaeton citri CBS 116435 TaxID=1314669 RepID=A0A9P4QBX4_9PEZI|nr:protocatechuate 3,4-dioxygenase, P3,4O [Polychaeton citri CBS 116435]
MPATYSKEEVEKAHQVLFDQGLEIRYKVAGKDYVDRSLRDNAGPFTQAMQQYVTESCWGSIWTRPGLDLKVRSFLNIAMLCSQNRSTELATHVKCALNNGASEVEIREVVLQAACYCGMPAGIEGFRVAGTAVEDWRAEKERMGHAVGEHADVDIGARVKPEEA